MKFNVILVAGLFLAGPVAAVEFKSGIVTDVVDGDTIIFNEKTPKVKREFVAEKGSKFYHDITCKLAKDIPRRKRIKFKDKTEAKKLGFYYDRWCLPQLHKNLSNLKE